MEFKIATVNLIANSIAPTGGEKPLHLPAPFIAGFEVFMHVFGMNQTAVNAMRALICSTPLRATELEAAKAEALTETEKILKGLVPTYPYLNLQTATGIYRPLGGNQHIMGFWIYDGSSAKYFTYPYDFGTGLKNFRAYVMIMLELKQS